MKEEYEKKTSAEGFVDYRAAGLLVTGCKPSKEQLEQQVQSSYHEKLNEDFLSTGRKISVTQVVLVSSGENKYEGVVWLIYQSQQCSVPITAISDGKTVVWQTKPGAFFFLLQ
jgi:hypothetical protein